MATTPPSQATSPEPDWAAQATDVVVNLVAQVRNRTTRPALLAARAVVYGFLAAVLGVAALVLLVIALVRFVDAYLPGDVWAAHLLLGGIFTIAGLLLWSRRRSPALDTSP